MMGTMFVVVGAVAIAIIGCEAIDRAMANAFSGRDAAERMKSSSNASERPS